MENPTSIKLFSSPWLWLSLIPIMTFLVSLFAHHSYASQIADIERNFSSNLKLKMEALEKIIGSRSGENSAKAADQKLTYGQPVFAEEIKELKETANQLIEGPTSISHPGTWDSPTDDEVRNKAPLFNREVAELMAHGLSFSEAKIPAAKVVYGRHGLRDARDGQSSSMWWMIASAVIGSLMCVAKASMILTSPKKK